MYRLNTTDTIFAVAQKSPETANFQREQAFLQHLPTNFCSIAYLALRQGLYLVCSSILTVIAANLLGLKSAVTNSRTNDLLKESISGESRPIR
jgi:hypothetical protein